MFLYDTPLASLATLKAYLKVTDTTDDTVLSELLLRVSSAIEKSCGRPVRRRHAQRQRFAGGGARLRVAAFPIARVHYVRASVNGVFNDSSQYQTLVEGEDWTLDAADSGEAGDDGWIASICGRFPHGFIEVCYTGGYKTADEVTNENGSVTFSGSTNTTLIQSLSAAERYDAGDTTPEGYIVQFLETTAEVFKVGNQLGSSVNRLNRGAIVFSPGAVFLPTWEAVQATLTVTSHLADGSGSITAVVGLLPFDARARLDDPEVAFNQMGSPTALLSGETGIINTHTRVDATPTAAAIAIHSDAGYSCGTNMKILNRSLRETGRIGFRFAAETESIGTNLTLGVANERNSTSGNRPSLVIVHRDTLRDGINMPSDLAHACLIQTVHEWNTRRTPGLKGETQRGVSTASGVAYTKTPLDFLPEVERIISNYTRAL